MSNRWLGGANYISAQKMRQDAPRTQLGALLKLLGPFWTPMLIAMLDASSAQPIVPNTLDVKWICCGACPH